MAVAVSTRTTVAQKYLARSTVRTLTRRHWAATRAHARRWELCIPAIDGWAGIDPTPTVPAAFPCANRRSCACRFIVLRSRAARADNDPDMHETVSRQDSPR
jgi:hypothetical protein